MSPLGFVQVFGGAKTDLGCFVAVQVVGLDLGDGARPSLNNGNGDYPPVGLEDLGHPNLCCQYALDQICFSRGPAMLSSMPATTWVRPGLVLLQLYSDIDARRQIEPGQGVDGLGCGFHYVNQSLVGPYFEVLPRILVHVG